MSEIDFKKQIDIPGKKLGLIIVVYLILIGIIILSLYFVLGLEKEPEPERDGLQWEPQPMFVLTISSSSGGTQKLEEAFFHIIDENGNIKYNLTINDSNPEPIQSGQSKIYPITHRNVTVTDSTGGALDGGVSLSDYTNCTIAYIDQNDDKKFSADDSIWIYIDNNNDGIDDVENKFTFKILNASGETIHSKQL